jgi:hypothetical protein
MILLDTNVFVIDRFFPRDERYDVNRRLVAQLSEVEAGFSIFSLFELCGISSFNLSAQELKRWSYHFDDVYGVVILEPQGLYTALAADWFARSPYLAGDARFRRHPADDRRGQRDLGEVVGTGLRE